MKKGKILLVVILIGLVVGFLNFVLSDDLIALQGNVQQSGVNLASGDLRVVIYDSYTGGNIIYNSSNDFTGNISNGKYDVMLGNGTQKLNLEYGKIYYIELYIKGTGNYEPFTFDGKTRQFFQSSVGKINGTSINPSQINGTHLIENINLIGNVSIGNNLSVAGNFSAETGFFSNLGSVLSKITNIWAINVNATNINTTSLFVSGVLTATTSGVNITGETNFNGKWNDGGVTISGGNIWAQVLYVYNITSVGVSNLYINGSEMPSLNNTWDLGNTTHNWRTAYFSNDIYIQGTGVKQWLFNQSQTFAENWTGNGTAIWTKSGISQVGIGTSTPTERFQVANDAAVVALLTGVSGVTDITGNTARYYIGNIQQTDNNFATIWFGDDAQGLTASAILASQITNHVQNYGNFQVWTRSASGYGVRLFIHEAGNIGIGTTTPTSLLNINGTGELLNISNSSTSIFRINESTFYSNVSFYAAGNLYVNQTNVGIGTTAPAYNLEIANSATSLNVSGNLYANSSRVGINTSLPTSELDVKGTTTSKYLILSGVDSQIDLSGATTAGVIQVSGNTFSFGDWSSGGNTYGLKFDIGGANAGNVGIVSRARNNKWTTGTGNIAVEMALAGAPSGTPSITGGSMADGTYYYVLDGIDAGGGENYIGTQSAGITITGSGGSGSVALTWSVVQGATSYKLYRTTVSGTYASPALIANVVGTSYTDIALNPSVGLPVQSFSSSNAFVNKLSSAGNSWFAGGNIGIGTSTPSYLLTIANSATAMNVSGNLYVNATNVGIGTSTPAQALNVVGDTNITKNVTVGNLIKLEAFTGSLGPCAILQNGSIGRNETGLYYCHTNSTWMLWKDVVG